MSASYHKIEGEEYLDPSFVVEGWVVKVELPEFQNIYTENGVVRELSDSTTTGYVFDRMDDDLGGYVGDFFWYKNAYGYLWNTKEEALKAFEDYWNKWWKDKKDTKKYEITKDSIFRGVQHIKYQSLITVLEV